MSTLFVSYWAKQPSDCLGFLTFPRLPSVCKVGMQFESHLGHDIFPRQRRFCFNLDERRAMKAVLKP